MITGLIVLFTANLIGGAITPLSVKLGTHEMSPFVFTFFRFLVATLVFLPVYLKNLEKLSKKSLIRICSYSIFFALNTTLYAIGIMFTTVLISQILYTLVPLVVGILSFILLKEKFSRYKIIGALIAFFGVLLLIYESFSKTQHLSLGSPLGNIIVLAAVFCWSLYIVLSKKLTQKFKPTTTSFYSYLVNTAMLIPFILFQWISAGYIAHNVSSVGIAAVLVSGSVSSALMFFLMQVGIKKTSAFVGSLFFYFAPFFSSLTAIPILHEKVTVYLIVGGLFIILGVFIATTGEMILKRMRQKE